MKSNDCQHCGQASISADTLGPVCPDCVEDGWFENETDQPSLKLPSLHDSATKVLSDFDELIAESGGVYGLHMNGDPSPWEELTAGGRYEEWLVSIETLRAVLEANSEATQC